MPNHLRDLILLTVHLVGQFAVHGKGKPIQIKSRAAQSLFAYLILNAGIRHRREWLADLVWPDLEEAKARKRLRHALWRLRQAVGSGYFKADRIAVAFSADAPYQLDVDVLKVSLCDEGPADELLPIVDAYAGDLLPGFYDEWVFRARETVRLAYEQQMQLLMCRLEAEGRWRDMMRAAGTWISHDDVAEPAYRALMLAHERLGESAGVVTTFRACCRSLQQEIGVPPCAETSALYSRLMQEGAVD